MTARLSFLCPRSRPDENGAHDIWQADSASSGQTYLYCRRCGETLTAEELHRQTAAAASLDGPTPPKPSDDAAAGR